MIDSSNRISNKPFVMIAISSHCYAFFVFGAVFWVDSIAYVSLGKALVLENGLRHFYSDIGFWFYSHLQVGLPIIWSVLENLPIDLHWPILAVFQHALAAFALYYFFSTLNTNWPSRWNYIACGLVAILPFYQAAHNSLMTESVSSSLLLIGLSLALRMRNDILLDRGKLFFLLLTLILATQFRSYFGVLIFGAALISLYKFNSEYFKISVILAIGLAVSVVAFPTYRYFETGYFWLPSLGMNSLQAGWWVNPSPTKETLQKLDGFEFPANLSPATRINKGLNYGDLADIALHWRNIGLTDHEINRRAKNAGGLLANDSSWVLINRALRALTSSGMVLPYCILDSNTIVFPGYSAKMLCDHIWQTYVFQSWLSSDDHQAVFNGFFNRNFSNEYFKRPFDEISSRSIYDDTKEYINNSKPRQKDPIKIGSVAPDALIIFALLAMVFANRKQRFFSLMCAWLVLGNAYVNYLASLGNPRYGYFLFPIYIAFAFLGLSQVMNWLREKTCSWYGRFIIR
jgi:hypothetical protein